jgi:hypothetical protein
VNALDRTLEALRASGPCSYSADPDRLDTWWARCPRCQRYPDPERRLEVVEHSSTSLGLVCSAGCDRRAILAALSRAEREYPHTCPTDDPEHVPPAWDLALAEFLLAQKRQKCRQRDAEARLEAMP